MLLAGVVSATAPFIARADVYETAYFSAQFSNISGSLASIGLSGSDGISGNFVFDEQMIPPAGSGMEGIPFSSIPNVGSISDSTAFQMELGGLTFNLNNFVAGTGAIAYDNGQFAGFDVQIDFFSQGSEYQFIEQGNIFEIELLANGQPTGDIVVSGSIGFSPASLFDVQPFDPFSSTDLTSGGSGPPGNSPPGNDPSPPGNDPTPTPEPSLFWVLLPASTALLARAVYSRRQPAAR
jgi:hypothetical protein